MVQVFLLGTLTAMFIVAAAFFLRFWVDTRDSLFLAFAASFFLEAISRIALLGVARPNEGNTMIYIIRLIASLLILAAIIRKNYGKRA
jgi:Family of unknown function (DUF5985)